MLDFKVPFYTDNYPKPIVGVPNLPSQVVDDHLLSTRETPAVITAADPPDRLRLAFAIVQNGRFLEFFGSPDDYSLFPMERIERLATVGRLEFPPLFVFHGEQDSAVPVDGTRRFVAVLRQLSPTAQVEFYTQDGDHGFDVEATLETPWLRDGLRSISKAWLDGRNVRGERL